MTDERHEKALEALRNAMDALPLPSGEPFIGKTYRADGWVYRDLPRMSYAMFDKFVELAGDDNLVWMTQADYGDSKRGQLLISPAGIDRLRVHVTPNHFTNGE